VDTCAWAQSVPRGGKKRYNYTVASSAARSGGRSVYGGDAASLYPHDSISQTAPPDEREEDQRAVMAYSDPDWYQRDPYAPKPQADIYGQEDYYDAHKVPALMTDGSIGRSHPSTSFFDETPLVAKDIGAGYPQEPKVPYEELEVGNIDEKKPRANWLLRALRDPSDIETRIENYKRGEGVQSRPWVCWGLTAIMTIVFIVELVNNVRVFPSPHHRFSPPPVALSSRPCVVENKQAKVAGSPFTPPRLNPMLGPSSELLINNGARFTACSFWVSHYSRRPLFPLLTASGIQA
jgi:hypothetical protein